MSTSLEPVVGLFSLLVGFATLRTLPSLVSFYASFRSSGLELAKHRGYGQSACKAYGLFAAPHLSVLAMALSGVAFLALVVLPSTPVCAAWLRAPCFGAALLFYHFYFSQLFCEAHVGAHVTVLIPPALIMLALSPALDAQGVGATADSRLAAAAFTCWMMKIVLTSAYCGAGVCKISHSLSNLRRGLGSWCTGSTLQAFIFEAMLLSTPRTHTSFGVPTPFSYALQKLHLLHPVALLMPASVGAVAFETLAPMLLLAPPHLASVPFAAFGLSFHYGICLLQNIDFMSWWSPAYAFLLADPAAWAGGGLFAPPAAGAPVGLVASTSAAYAAAPLRVSLCLAYVAVHVLAVLALRFFPNVEILPLSSFPMFGSPQNLFDGRVRKHFWLTDKAHATGTLKNYAFPFCRAQTVLPHEISALPFKYLLFSHGGPPVGASGKPAEPTMHTNVQVSPRLASALDRLKALGAQAPDTYAVSEAAAPALLAVLGDAKAAFAEAPRVGGAAPQPKQAPAQRSDELFDATPSTASVMAAAPSSDSFGARQVASKTKGD